MTVDTISNNKIRIELTNEEIDIFFGGYEHINYSDPDSKLAINLLLKEALPDEMLPLDCKRVLLEVSPTRTGCLILFTKLYSKSKRRYKVIGCTKSYIITFTNSEDMITACKELAQIIPKPVKSELFFDNDGYYLLLHSSINITKQLIHINEYCNTLGGQQELIARVSEYAKQICKEKAIEKIAKAF